MHKKILELEQAQYPDGNAAHGETTVEFFKRLYHEQLVMDAETGLPALNAETGTALTKAEQIQLELDKAHAELEALRARMQTAETIVHLKRVQLKARQLKRKYRHAVQVIADNLDDFHLDDNFCNDEDKGMDSDTELQSDATRMVMMDQDIALPFGFSAVEVLDDNEDDREIPVFDMD